MISARNDLRAAFDKIRKATQRGFGREEKRKTALEAIRIIRVRTRLGYGVKSEGGPRFRLSTIPWSDRYALFRKSYPQLSEFTRPTKHNLTLTGQMLDSLTITSESVNTITVGPTGGRFDTGKTNDQIARYQANAGRVFMNLSKNETTQLLRFYRRSFTDLLKRIGLLR